jgi:large subunit ribosomal protein L17
MRHQRSGKKLGRDSAHRKALYANLTGALIEHGRIKTTVTKAKAVKPIAEQLITLGRRGDMHARRQAVAFLRSKEIVHKLFAEIGPAFAERPGGYLRITRIGPRPGDSAEMAYLELVDTPLVFKTNAPPVVEDEVEEADVERRRGGGRARAEVSEEASAEDDEATAEASDSSEEETDSPRARVLGLRAEQGADADDHGSRQGDDRERAGEARAEEPPAQRRERDELEGDDHERKHERGVVARNQKGQRVQDAADECPDPGDAAADHRAAAAGELAVSESPSENAIEMPAPIDVARPAMNA